MNKTCRRCSDCQGMTHHWIEGDDFSGDGEAGGSEFVCKHCEQPGRECDQCEGLGCFEEVDCYAVCAHCDGEGVVATND